MSIKQLQKNLSSALSKIRDAERRLARHSDKIIGAKSGDAVTTILSKNVAATEADLKDALNNAGRYITQIGAKVQADLNTKALAKTTKSVVKAKTKELRGAGMPKKEARVAAKTAVKAGNAAVAAASPKAAWPFPTSASVAAANTAVKSADVQTTKTAKAPKIKAKAVQAPKPATAKRASKVVTGLSVNR